MNSGQKKIFLAVIAYTLIWNAQYLWEYLPGPFDIIIFLLLILAVITLILIGIIQLYKYLSEKQKIKSRLINTSLIFLISILSYLKPNGLIDFKKFEGQNILYAFREGVANCTTSIRLKEKNRFKKTSICFGINHSWGSYEIKEDTIKFYYDQISTENKKNDFAIIKLEKDSTKKRFGHILYHTKGTRKNGIPLFIKTLNKEKFK